MEPLAVSAENLTAAKTPVVDVIIVNWNEAALTIGCLRTLDAEMKLVPGLRVTVADNGSKDDSVPRIQAEMERLAWGERGTVVAVGSNNGFSAGNNAGIRNALARPVSPDYVFLLNPDTLVHPGAIGTLIEFMEKHPEVGLTGSRMMYPDGRLQMSSFRFHSVFSEFENSVRLGIISKLLKRWQVVIPLPDEPVQVDWVGGASMMIRRAVVDKIGLLDETYFVYYEETDYCLRARRAGWTSWYIPQSVITHIEGQATGVSDRKKAPKRRPPYWFASRRHYFVHNYGRLTALTADLLWVIGFSSYRVRQFIQRKPDTDPPYFLRDFIRHNFFQRPRRV